MPDDKQLSQLVSESLRREVSDDEQKLIDDHLANSEESRKFAELSRIIENSVAISGKEQLESSKDAPRLSEDARNRFKQSIAVAINDRQTGNGDSVKTELGLTNSGSGIESQRRELSSRFQLIRLLNKGGLGNIWLARDKKLNRTVAIKELHRASLESPQAWERFRREAEITGHLEHPNVVPIHQYGEDRETGEPFYVMRFVGKRTLADAIEEHHDRMQAGQVCPVSKHRLLSVFLDICQAIAYAHSRGVIHRDLKPDNVALDNFGQVIVLDWGLAKVQEDGELASKLSQCVNLTDSTLRQTMHGDVVGTPLYMAPEQAAGTPDEIDTRTDVYGLGAILFAILAGEAPHQQSLDVETESLDEVLSSIATGETPEASDLNPNVPRELDEICATAMARKRHLRFSTVTQLADAVERWMAGQSGKQAAYDSLRMEGRELRADLKSAVCDLERNVRFMSTLPPIQQLIKPEADDVMVWRERLAQIFHGLLRANPDYRNVVYSRVDNGELTEIVRVERHSTDASSIRIVPKSKLRTAKTNDHIESLVNLHPDEVLSSLACDPLCDKELKCATDIGLVVGVPVYDKTTEEVFGVVMITCDFGQLLRKQMNRRSSAAELVVACDVFHVMMHSQNGRIADDSNGKPVKEVASRFLPAIAHLQQNSEFIDTANANVYGARLWFIPDQHGVMYLLRRAEQPIS